MSVYIYIVVENGEPYPVAYMTFTASIAAVKLKHKEALDEEEAWLEKMGAGQLSINYVDVPESIDGVTHLYIEKALHIEIYKLPVVG